MNWKAVVGVSMLCITMMIRCEEKKTHSSRSNETVKEKVGKREGRNAVTCGEYDYNMQNYLWRKRVKLVANTGYCRGAYRYR